MSSTTDLPRRTRLLIALTLWWSLGAWIQALSFVQMSAASGIAVEFGEALRASLARNLTWVPICLLIVWLVERHTVEAGRYVRSLGVLAAAGAAVAVVKSWYMALSNAWFGWFDTLPSFPELLLISVRTHFLLFWLCVGAAHALVFFERAQQHKLRNSQLETSLAQARLDALSAQINPHFLFNALNSVAELVHQDATAAERMLVGLSALLRQSLARNGAAAVPLREEIELLVQYLGIEQVRLGPRLRLRWSLAPDSLDVRVPPLLLQPLLENAVIHAVARRRQPGEIVVTTCLQAQQLLIRIEDDGADGAAARAGSGIGLANTRARLACLYGEAASLQIGASKTGGTCVELRLPLQAQDTTSGRPDA